MGRKILSIASEELHKIKGEEIEFPENFREMLLTTQDNPFSPFDDHKNWHSYDRRLGYYTSETLASLIGSETIFNETPLGNEVEERFIYSTMVGMMRSISHIPFILVTEADYDENGHLKIYDPSAGIKLVKDLREAANNTLLKDVMGS